MTHQQQTQEHQILEERIKHSLDTSAQHLDANTKRRLQEIRRQALNQPRNASWFKTSYWAPAGLALCSLFVVMLTLPYLHKAPTAPVADQTAMLELMSNPDDLDALSDPGFYVWMDEVEKEKDAANAA
jgi:hypothetical protein